MRIRAAARLEPRAVRALLASYSQARLAAGHSAQTTRAAARMLERLLGYLERRRVRDVRDVREGHLAGFLLRQCGHLATGTRGNWIGLLRSFFAWLVQRGVLLESPAQGLPRPREERLPRHVPSASEVSRLLSVPLPAHRQGARDRAILEVLYGSGLRARECLGLDLGNVDLVQRQALVLSGKGRRDRVVPLTRRAVEALLLYLSEARPRLSRSPGQTALFLSNRGLRLSHGRLWELLVEHARAARISRPVPPHALRHACATHLLRGGASVRHVQALLGHRRLETTALYTRVSAEDLRDVVRRCHPREWRRKPRRGPKRAR